MIEPFLRREQLVNDSTAKNLAEPYLKKSRANLVTMEILSNSENHKDILAIPQNHSTDEWVVVAAYYAMYMSALSLLAQLGYKSKSHTATVVALEEFFVKKNLLDKAHLDNLKNLHVKKEEVSMLREVKDRREIAQYSVTKKTTKDLAEKTKLDARAFVDRVEEIFELLKNQPSSTPKTPLNPPSHPHSSPNKSQSRNYINLHCSSFFQGVFYGVISTKRTAS